MGKRDEKIIFWAQLLGTVILGAVLFTVIQRINPAILDVDGYYHIRIAQLMRGEFFINRLPQADLTLFRDAFADTLFGFHVFLMPFTGGDLTAGAKLAVIIMNLGVVVSLYLILWRAGVRWALAALAGLGLLAAQFWYQLLPPRAHLLSIIMTLWSIDAWVHRRNVRLGILCGLQALTYTAWHFIPGLMFICFIAESFSVKKLHPRPLIAACLGAAIGLLLHPFPFVHLHLWFVQNVLFFVQRIASPDVIPRGTEWSGLNPRVLIELFWGELIFLTLGFFFWWKTRGRHWVWGLLGAVTLLMTCGSVKFCHYASPLVFVWFAVALAVFLKDQRVTLTRTVVGLLVVVGLFSMHQRYQWLRNFNRYAPNYSQEDILALAQNVPQGAHLFNCTWLTNPEIFFHRPDLRVPVLLDPVFAYYAERERYRAWADVCRGLTDKPPSERLKTLGYGYAMLSIKDKADMQQALHDDAGLSLVWSGPRYRLFKVL